MDHEVLTNITTGTLAPATATAMTGSGDSDLTPTHPPPPPPPLTITPASTPATTDPGQLKCLPVRTSSSEGSKTKGDGRQRTRDRGDGEDGGGEALDGGDSESTTDGDSTTSDAGDVEVEVDDDRCRCWGQRLSSHSHRSVRCPHGRCRRTVSAAGFLAHFRYEHRSVACARLSTHHALRFTLGPHCLGPTRPPHPNPHTIVLCVAQVNISGDYEELEVYSGPGGENDEHEGDGEWASGRMSGGDVAVCALFGRVATLGGGGAALALWCGCLFDPLDLPPVAYTLRATLLDQDDQGQGTAAVARVYRYHGPAECARQPRGGGGGLFLPPDAAADSARKIALRLRFHRIVPRPHNAPKQ